ncbi:MAG TPA: multidrug efflux RND transporter permease subunit [Novimethylophilus sp.]|jgi:multidrug efflux pump|uniref:multidrug efflux RND transporter permease subunit n=1 Tax=Novimethylophilus sp. TaxID=2137426 RepID=UPI002F4061E0
MNFSAIFIHRPVATSLLTLAVTLAGAVAFGLLPVAPLPQVDFPTIAVEASLPGASPETMATAVATPLERSLGRIAGISEMTSMSSLGSTRITLQFDLERDINGAARDVQAAINAARTLLPTGLPTNPIYHKVNPADAPIMILALTSDSVPQGKLYDAASTVLVQKLSQVRGVGQVSVGGSSLPAVRVELNPAALHKYGIGLADVGSAISATNANRPKGILEQGDRRWQIYANDQARTAKEYLPLIISYRNGAPVRLADVAEVADSVQDLRNEGLSNGKPAVLLQIRRQPNANIIETVDRVKAVLPQLKASISGAIDVNVVSDRSPTIRASVHDVELALTISIGLVIMVVFVFLRSARATLIPSVAVPVSLVGTFGVMYLYGYSLDNLSLMALTVATGFVVDDAIVVLENVSRHIEQGVSPFEAALKGTREVAFTVLSMSISLVAVFIPLLLMGGIVGRLLREFAVTLSVAVLVSLLVSLTATPMMCARLLKHRSAEKPPGRLSAFGEHCFNAMLGAYRRSLDVVLRHGVLTMLALFFIICLNFYLYIIVPKGFFPQQDTGRLIGTIQADQGISFQAMRKKLAVFVEMVRSDPAVENVVGFVGGGQRNTGFMFVTLKPMAQRQVTGDQVTGRLRGKLSRVAGANLFLQPVQDIRVGGRPSNAQYQYTLQGDNLAELRAWEPRIRQAMTRLPQLTDVNTDQQDKGYETVLTIDRDAAARLGVTTKLIDSTLNGAFGQRQVSTIYAPLNQYYVIMEVAPQYWQSPEALRDIYLSTPNGTQVPLTAVSRFEPGTGPLAVNHQGQFAASTISFNLPVGVSLSQAASAIDGAFAGIGVPGSVRGGFQGTAKVFQASLENQPWLILSALFAVYIVLGMLYESYIHPLTILSTLPSAGVGALLALLVTGGELNIMAMIGIILLIGIVKKNAIMMIDFAVDAERSRGISPKEAIYEACLLRFRPITMTTMAALLGALPLASGIGEGSELRQPLGISIIGGLLFSQMLTLYTTPVVYLYLDRFSIWSRRTFRRHPVPAA